MNKEGAGSLIDITENADISYLLIAFFLIVSCILYISSGRYERKNKFFSKQWNDQSTDTLRGRCLENADAKSWMSEMGNYSRNQNHESVGLLDEIAVVNETVYDPNNFADDPNDFANDSNNFADDPNDFANDSNRFANDPNSFADDPNSFADDPNSFADD